MNQRLYQQLVIYGTNGDLPTYGEVAPSVGLDMALAADRNEFARLLDEINEHEHEHGRPLISSIVVLKDSRVPGKGYFDCARRLGRLDSTDHFGEMDFWVSECNAVYRHWGND